MTLRITALQKQISTPLPLPEIQVLRKSGTLDVQDFFKVAFGPYHNLRKEVFDVCLKNKHVFRHAHIEDVDRETERKMTYEQLRFYLEHQIISFEDVEADPVKGTVVSNALYAVNPSMNIIMGVHYWLYMKTLMSLGTHKHAHFKKRASEWKDIGCFALTEIIHGSNVKGILTEAHYCHDTSTFIIHSPSKESMKFWIGGAANAATMTIVWAQLYINGKCHGVHAYVVPLRDNDTRDLLPGVLIGDCGPKNGLNGVDNGFIMFDKVRIPKDNQLNLISGVDDDGNYITTESNDNKRFGLQLAPLSGGRTILSFNSIALAINAITIAIRYTLQRKQFSAPKSNQELLLFSYPLTKYRLMTILAQTVVYHFGSFEFTLLWDKNFYNILDPKNTVMTQLHAISSILKAKASWFTSSTIAECRQMLGGHGYSIYSRLGPLFNDNDINCTYEGDNNILLQQTAKYVFDGARRIKEGKPISSTLNFLKENAKPQQANQTNLKCLDYLQSIICYRIRQALADAEQLFGQEAEKGTPIFDIWNITQIHQLREASFLFGDLYYLRACRLCLPKFSNQRNKQIMTDCILLWVWKTFQSSHYGDEETRRLVQTLITEYFEIVSKQAVRILDALAPPSEIIGSPFADEHGDGMKKYYNLLYAGKDTFKKVDWYELMTENANRNK